MRCLPPFVLPGAARAFPRAGRCALACALCLLMLPPARAQDGIPVATPIPPAGAIPAATPMPEAAAPAPEAAPLPIDTPAPAIAPSWETQRQARTYSLGIPAPRGQITDSHGSPLAQTRVSYNVAMEFPAPNYSESALLDYAHQQIDAVRQIVNRPSGVTDAQILKHYRNRSVIPLDIIQDLVPADIKALQQAAPPHITLHPVYQRFYPNGFLAAHVIGYAGKSGRVPDGPIQNNELLWPNTEGRAGIEQSFNAQLTGRVGQMNIAFDANGLKTSEKVVIPPQPGYNVVTTLDADMQRMAEQALQKGAKRGAVVILDPNNGDVLALASWPVFDPNAFVPTITPAAFKALNDDPNNPLLPRAYGSGYPPGSTFKVIVGLAALESGAIKPETEFGCPAAMEIGNRTFHNWKKKGSGMLNFVQALTQSCDTYFYQVGIKTGSKPISDWAVKAGLGTKTGIPIAGEVEGRVPTDAYMQKVYGRKLLNGDIANLAIGQGDLLVSPLQLAQAMGAIGNGGTLYQTRLVRQVQTIDSKIVTAYEVRVKEELGINPDILAQIKKGMVDVVSSAGGTASAARIDNVEVAGKTGTAQWGPKSHERTAAWFAGFAPADKPKYAFAAVYEGAAGAADIHGGVYAAPLVAKVLRQVFKDQAKPAKPKKRGHKSDDEDTADNPPAHAKKRTSAKTTNAGDAAANDAGGVPVKRAKPVDDSD